MTNIKGFTNTQKIKEEAANWLLRIDENAKLSSKESEELNNWVATSSVHRAVIVQMSQTWNNMDVLTAMRVAPERKLPLLTGKFKAWLGSLILSTLDKQNNTTPGRTPLYLKWGAISVCLLASFLIFNSINDKSVIITPDYYVTDIGEYKKQQLEDGSTLWLNSNSKVTVAFSENYRRIELITGEAHFEVKKDTSRPFEVYSMNRLVRALGTAFSVHKMKDHVEVLVSEGTVELAIVDEMLVLKPDDLSDSTDIKIIKEEKTTTMTNKPAKVTKYLGKLSAGQSVSIPMASTASIESDGNNIVYLEKGDITRKLSWLDGKLDFAGESLEEVVTEISRHTSIIIDVPDPNLRKLRIGGHFEAGETDKLFYLLESGFGIKVKKIDENHVELITEQ